MDIQNSELLPADVDHPDVVEQITISTVHTIVVADIQNSEQLVDVVLPVVEEEVVNTINL